MPHDIEDGIELMCCPDCEGSGCVECGGPEHRCPQDGIELVTDPSTQLRVKTWSDDFWRHQPRAWQLANYCFRARVASHDGHIVFASLFPDTRLTHPVYPAGEMRADFTIPLGS